VTFELKNTLFSEIGTIPVIRSIFEKFAGFGF
jgi:hypothetical protein